MWLHVVEDVWLWLTMSRRPWLIDYCPSLDGCFSCLQPTPTTNSIMTLCECVEALRMQYNNTPCSVIGMWVVIICNVCSVRGMRLVYVYVLYVHAMEEWLGNLIIHRVVSFVFTTRIFGLVHFDKIIIYWSSWHIIMCVEVFVLGCIAFFYLPFPWR